jgi:hypothetical protein
MPHERDARIIGKHVIERLFGQERTAEFIAQKIAHPVDDPDSIDWEFIQRIASSNTYDVDFETHRLFQHLAPYRKEHTASSDTPTQYARKGKENPDPPLEWVFNPPHHDRERQTRI